jgi:hypothetical protein
MDLAAVFLLSLLGGYLFSSLWRFTGFSTRRIEGHHLYFRAALYGALLFLVALLLRIFALPHIPGYSHLDDELLDYVKPALKEETGLPLPEQARRAEWLLTAVYSLLIGPFFGALLNIFTSRRWAQERSLGALNRLLLRGQQQDMPVQLTLNTGKVYIGMPTAITDPDREPDFVKVVPMYSGYRDSQGGMVLTTDYEALYEALEGGKATQLQLPEDFLSTFELAIRAETIVSAILFAPAVYATFNPDWQQKMAAHNQKQPPQELIIEIKRPIRPSYAQPGTTGVAQVGGSTGPLAATPSAPKP